MVEFGVDAVKQEVGLFESSTLVRGWPIRKIGVNMAKKDGWQVEEGMEEYKAEEEVWTIM